MADKKVTQLTALTVPTKDDLLLVIDDPLGSPVSKKITVDNFFGATSTVSVNAISISAVGTSTLSANTFTINSVNGLTVNTGITINSSGADSDTRIASDNQTNMFFVDASADKIGVMTNAPTEALDINSDAIRIRTAQTPASGNNTAVGWGVGTISWDANYLYVAANSTNIVRVALSAF
jgi:hypothetical protein